MDGSLLLNELTTEQVKGAGPINRADDNKHKRVKRPQDVSNNTLNTTAQQQERLFTCSACPHDNHITDNNIRLSNGGWGKSRTPLVSGWFNHASIHPSIQVEATCLQPSSVCLWWYSLQVFSGCWAGCRHVQVCPEMSAVVSVVDTVCCVYMFLSLILSLLSPSSPSLYSWFSAGWFFPVSLDLLKVSSC